MSAWQHCGRLDDHPEHRFTARKRIVVQSCECNETPCICPISMPVHPSELSRESFRCPGKLKTEGTPPHMPVQV